MAKDRSNVFFSVNDILGSSLHLYPSWDTHSLTFNWYRNNFTCKQGGQRGNLGPCIRLAKRLSKPTCGYIRLFPPCIFMAWYLILIIR